MITLPRSRLSLNEQTVIDDYRLAYRSRTASIVGRREVIGRGRATFGIFGDGKEVAQLAMAKAFKAGDWRAGYYRDQTFAWATGISNMREFFGQLYGDTDPAGDPASRGRQMNNHFATRFIDEHGNWLRSIDTPNSSSDVSCVAGWMPRLLGLAYASKLYRENRQLDKVADGFSVKGNEVAFGTIGDASTSEGQFWETMNAACVLQVPLAMSVWDDGYGISVPTNLQTARASISEALSGLGIEIHVVRGWDYAALCDTYVTAIEKVRMEQRPVLIHVVEITQPLGHSSSGSHENYKSKERLQWEQEHDCVARMRNWIIEQGVATAKQLDTWETADREAVDAARDVALETFQAPIAAEAKKLLHILEPMAQSEPEIANLLGPLQDTASMSLRRSVVAATAERALQLVAGTSIAGREELSRFVDEYTETNTRLYTSHLFNESERSPLKIESNPPVFTEKSEAVDGRLLLVKNFDTNFARDPRIFAIGEDVGKLGDVNKVYEGLQAKYGPWRLTDTGIREATILGQAIGAAMRGLRPIADIQYLDYLIYALQTMSDDLATLHWRSAGAQAAPVVIRTKGHRLVGVWHSGSPMSSLMNACRGIYLCVPRDMMHAAGMYNTLFRGDNPGIVIEVLNAYRFKEQVPDNIGEFTIPLGVPEVMREGKDITLVTYGALCRITMEAAATLSELGVEATVIDVQTLDPFDVNGIIAEHVARTHAVLFIDEDVPGGATAYMMQQVLEKQGAWWDLDAAPKTLSAVPNRPAYGPDGDYYCKPNRESIVNTAYAMLRERRPSHFPPLR